MICRPVELLARRVRTSFVNRTFRAILFIVVSVAGSSAQPPEHRLTPSALDEKLFRALFENSAIAAVVTIKTVQEHPEAKPPCYSIDARIDEWFRGEDVFRRNYPPLTDLPFMVFTRSTSLKPASGDRCFVFLTTEPNTGLFILSSYHFGLIGYSDALHVLLRRVQRSYLPSTKSR